MQSTKYQLLKDDFDHACEQMRIKNETIKDLRKKLDKIKFLKHCFYGDKKQLHEEIERIINE